MIYNGENHMVLPCYTPEYQDTVTERVRLRLSVMTVPANIGRWAGYTKRNEEIDLVDNYHGFETEINVESLAEEDWDDDMGRVVVADKDDLRWQVSNAVHAIDPEAEYEII